MYVFELQPQWRERREILCFARGIQNNIEKAEGRQGKHLFSKSLEIFVMHIMCRSSAFILTERELWHQHNVLLFNSV